MSEEARRGPETKFVGSCEKLWSSEKAASILDCRAISTAWSWRKKKKGFYIFVVVADLFRYRILVLSPG